MKFIKIGDRYINTACIEEVSLALRQIGSQTQYAVIVQCRIGDYPNWQENLGTFPNKPVAHKFIENLANIIGAEIVVSS